MGLVFPVGGEFCAWSYALNIGKDNQIKMAGDAAPHISVMLDEVLDALEPAMAGLIVDGTFGAGGYSKAMLKAGARVVGLDQDENVQEFADALSCEYGDRFSFVMGRFSELDELAKDVTHEKIDAVVLDIGVSSMQLDEGERGFSFMRDGPLDMRMGTTGQSAADLVNTADERLLSDIIFAFGEEKRARRIAKAIIEARIETPITTTLQLAEIIEGAVGRKPGGNHPATRTFQAIRIAVNREMDELVRGLFAAERLLAEEGILVVVTFHSLEDRIVKRFFDAKKSAGTTSRHMPFAEAEPMRWRRISKPKKAGDDELLHNPRARSATLRCAQRTGHAPREFSYEGLGVPGSRLIINDNLGAT